MSNNRLTWVKSSYSGSQGGNCVEVAADRKGGVLVRDTKNREAAVLGFRPVPWLRFATEVKAGRRVLGTLGFRVRSGASSVQEASPSHSRFRYGCLAVYSSSALKLCRSIFISISKCSAEYGHRAQGFCSGS